jgi:hypothetical protein
MAEYSWSTCKDVYIHHSTQILIFICHYYKYEPAWVVKHQSLKLATVSCSTFNYIISRNMCQPIILCCMFFPQENTKGPWQKTAVPRSYIQVLFWTKLSTVWGFEYCEVVREGFHSEHTLYAVHRHVDIFFLQESVNCLSNIILWELVMFLLHTHIIHATLEHIKLVENRANLHGETKRINAGETSARWC